MSAFVGKVQQLASNISPWWFRRRVVGTFLESFGMTLDSGLESLEQGVKLTRPLECDPSALPVLSKDRGIQLYPSEPLASQRYRLSQWWQLHRQRGTHQGEMRHVAPYFLPNAPPTMRIVHQDGAGASATWHTLDTDGTYSVHRATGSNWNYDGQTNLWSRYWFILYAPTGFLSLSHYDDGGTYDSGEAYDGILNSQVALDLIDMVRDWKAAHTRLEAFIIATDPTSFDLFGSPFADPSGWTTLPIGNWGQPINSLGQYTRPPSAFWMYTAT